MKLIDKIYDSNLNKAIKSILIGSVPIGLIIIAYIIGISNRKIGIVLILSTLFIIFSWILGDLLLYRIEMDRKNKKEV